VWLRHWGLSRDPFVGIDSPYVPLPSHDEALYRLVDSIEQAQRQVIFRAEAGMGKTTVLRRAIAQSRSPRRRFAFVSSPSDRTLLFSLLAEKLGQSADFDLGRQSTWRALARAVGVAALEGSHVVLTIDDWDDRDDPVMSHDLDALAHRRVGGDASVTVIRVARTSGSHGSDPADSWSLAIGLRRLTRSQVEVYLAAKLGSAGCTKNVFTPRALTRLHGLTDGVPRGLEHLARLSLLAGAVGGLEAIGPEVIDGVVQEFRGAAPRLGIAS
jgi:type II secretory pathway predicted ATPase ExeA